MSATKNLIAAILNAYHKTCMASTPVGDFIAANDNVKKAFTAYDATQPTRTEAGEGEAVFTIRVGGDRTHLHTNAKSIEPERAINLAIEALQAERDALHACPYHNKQEQGA